MSTAESTLERAHQEALNLHGKINAELAEAQTATHEEVRAVEDRAVRLAAWIRTIAVDQTEALKGHLEDAVARLETASHEWHERASASAEDLREARVALMGGARSAAHSLSQAVSALRGKEPAGPDPEGTDLAGTALPQGETAEAGAPKS